MPFKVEQSHVDSSKHICTHSRRATDKCSMSLSHALSPVSHDVMWRCIYPRAQLLILSTTELSLSNTHTLLLFPQFAVVKMRLFARVLCLEGHDDVAADATAAFERLVAKVCAHTQIIHNVCMYVCVCVSVFARTRSTHSACMCECVFVCMCSHAEHTQCHLTSRDSLSICVVPQKDTRKEALCLQSVCHLK